MGLKVGMMALILGLALVSQVSVAQGACQGKPGAAGTFELAIESGGMERTFILDVPPTYDPTEEAPLVFNFHGLLGTAQGEKTYTDLVEPAFDRGMIVVFMDHPMVR